MAVWSSAWAAVYLIPVSGGGFDLKIYIFQENSKYNIAHYNTRNSYTTTVLKKYHEVAVGRNHGDNTPPSFLKLGPKQFFLIKCSNPSRSSGLTGSLTLKIRKQSVS